MSRQLDLSRRRLLRSGAGLLAGAAAGCAGRGAGTTTPPSGSVVRSIAFDGSDLLVELRSAPDVARVTLIGPDGRRVADTGVATGATTVRLPILRIRPAPGVMHYTPGVHELVTELTGRTASIDLPLRPAPRITSIGPHRAGDRTIDRGRLAVTVENRGTGPTWIHDVTYRDAPNPTANDGLSADPGTPQLAEPTSPAALVLEPGTQATYVGTAAPLRFPDDVDPRCAGRYELSVLVGTAVGDPLERRVRVRVGGDARPAGLTGEFICPTVAVEPLGGGLDG